MDEDFEFDANTNNDDDPQWTSLTTEQKKELMSAVFEDDEWYSGTPAHIGGQSLPEFGEIASRLSAPKSDIQKYYAAWVKMKGLNPQEVMSRGKTMEPAPTAAPPTSAPAPEMIPNIPPSSGGNGVAGQMKGALINDMLGSMFGGTGGPQNAGNDMKYMMGMMMMSNMLESERRQHEANMQLQREQFAASQNNSIRQEQQQRQDMMMTQQMNFMNNMFKQGMKTNEDEFGSMLKAAAMERVADSMFGQSESTAERILSKVLDTEALGAVVSAGRGVMANRQSQVPAGYDVPSYNPYAQPLNNPPQADMQPEQPAPTGSDNFFEGPEQPQPEVVAEVSDQEFSDTLLEAFRQNMGAQLEDEKTRKALARANRHCRDCCPRTEPATYTAESIGEDVPTTHSCPLITRHRNGIERSVELPREWNERNHRHQRNQGRDFQATGLRPNLPREHIRANDGSHRAFQEHGRCNSRLQLPVAT